MQRLDLWLQQFRHDQLRPDDDNSHSPDVEEDNYGNRSFIADRYYARYDASRFEKYAKVVHYFREVLQGNVTDTPFVDYLDGLTVSTSPLSSSNYGFGNQEYLMRMGYVGWWDPATSTYKGKYDRTPSLTSSRGPSIDCPKPILPLTNVKADIQTHVNSLSADGNTDIAHGAAWGWRVLSKQAPFTEGIGPGDTDYEKWQKAIVIMTEPDSTIQVKCGTSLITSCCASVIA